MLSIIEACEILGVRNPADQQEIQKKWRVVAKKYHPDLNPNNKNAEKKFKECRDAYERLNMVDEGIKIVVAMEEDVLNDILDEEFEFWSKVKKDLESEK